jgi:predicted DNA-binding transcriptional regulator YafY
LPPLIFTEDEATAMVLGLMVSPRLELEYPASAVTAAISKITRVLPESAREKLQALSHLIVVPGRNGDTNPSMDLLIELTQAVQSCRTVALTYTSAKDHTTERMVEPYGLVALRSKWYLVGFCRLRKDFRTFRLDRINALQLHGESFLPKPEFDCRAYVAEHLETYAGNTPFSVLFQSDIETVRRAYADVAGHITEVADGVLFKGWTDDFLYEAQFLARLGTPFRVIEPEGLRDAVQTLARQLLEGASVGTTTA